MSKCSGSVGSGARVAGGNDATARLSRLSDRWEALMQSRKQTRAELALATALFDPYERAACKAHFAAHPLPDSAQQPFLGIVREDSPNVLVGTLEERDAKEAEHESERLEAAKHQRSRKGKFSRNRPPAVLPFGDRRDDSLDFARYEFTTDYPIRLAQANSRKSGTIKQWREYARLRGLEVTSNGEPMHDTAQDLLTNLWSQCWLAAISGSNRPIEALRMGYDPRESSDVEITPIPPALAQVLTPLQQRLVSLLPDCPPIAGNLSELSRRTGIWRDALPAMLESLKSAALLWSLEYRESQADCD